MVSRSTWADVVVGVTGGVHGLQLDWAGVDHVAVADRAALAVDLVTDGDHVLGFSRTRKLQPAGEVIVVDVGLQYMG